MKNCFGLLVALGVMLISSCFATSYWTEEEIEERTKGNDQIYDFVPDEEVYIKNYDELKNTIQDVEPDSLYKEAYYEMVADEIRNYKNTSKQPVYKAKVVEIEDDGAVKEYYPSSGYDIYKFSYQVITVEMLEGELKGKQFKTEFVLTADTYENLYIEPLKVGQLVNVVTTVDEEDGGITVYPITLDASVIKTNKLVFLILVTVICVVVLLGKYGLRILPSIILIADLAVLVVIPEIFYGRSMYWLAIISAIAYVIVETAIKLGINKKALMAILSTFSIVLITTLLFYGFNKWSMMNGLTLEVSNMMELYPVGNIDYYHLGIIIFMMMMMAIASNISCQAVRVYFENDEKVANEKIRKYVSGMIPIIVIIVLAVNMQKHLYLMIMKYSFQEVINSEIVLTEWIRGLFLVIGACLTPEVAKQAKKLFE